MKKLKLFVLLILCLFFTGCTVDYNIVIDNNKNVKESIWFNFKEEDLREIENKNVKEFLNSSIDSYKDMRELNGYKFFSNDFLGKVYIRLEKEYSGIENYQYSPFLRYTFLDVVVVENNNGISFTANGTNVGERLFNDELDVHGSPTISEYSFVVKLYNNVIDHNADNYNEKDNVLEWRFTSDVTDKDVYFKIGNDVRYDVMIMDMIARNLSTIIVIGSIVGILLIASLYFVIIYRRNNAI